MLFVAGGGCSPHGRYVIFQQIQPKIGAVI
jgi:hypothetical protein